MPSLYLLFLREIRISSIVEKWRNCGKRDLSVTMMEGEHSKLIAKEVVNFD